MAGAETSGDYTYTVNSGGTSVSITKYSGSSETVDIPSTLDGLPVTAIAEAAFKGNSAMATVIVPEGVTTIEKDAFCECTSLKNVYLPASLTSAVSGKESGFHGSFHGCPGGRCCYGPDGSYAQNFAADDGVGFVVASTVRFVTNGGTAVTTQIVAKNSTLTDMSTSKDDYHLIGWYTEPGFENEFKFGSPVTGDMTLYAKWESDYSYAETTGGIKITGYVGSKTELVIPSIIDDKQVVAIGYTNRGAFQGNESITSVVVPEGVTTIEKMAFGNCISLRTVYLPVSLTNAVTDRQVPEQGSFHGCPGNRCYYASDGSYAQTFADEDGVGFVSVSIVQFVTNGGSMVEAQTIANNTKLTDVSTTRNGYSFNGWYTDESLQTAFSLETPITGNLTLYAGWLINSYSVTFETNGGTAVESQSVAYNTALSEVSTTKDDYHLIGWYMESNFTTEFDFSTHVTSDMTLYAKWESDYSYTHAFMAKGITIMGYNGSKTELVIPASIDGEQVVAIGFVENYYHPIYDGGFQNNEKITSVVIPESVTAIGSGAFQGCINLTSVKLPSGLRTICQNAFSGTAIEEIDLPDSVTYIGQSAFAGSQIRSVVIPDGLSSISSNLFNGCTSLESVTLPSTLREVEKSAFYGCSALTSIVVPEGVASIGDAAFEGCTSLERAGLPSTLTTMGSGAFKGCRKVSFYGPHTAAAHDYAQDNYIPEYHKVTFLTNGGPKVDEVEVLCGKAVSTPQATGYTCKACYADTAFQSAYDFSAAVCDNLTLYVEWALDTHTVSFAANGGAEVENQTVQYDKQASEPQTSRDGYTFLGWYVDESLTQKYDFATPVTCDITLYAKWDVTVPSSFDDVATGDWYHKWVNEAARLGIMTGYKDADGAYTGSFGPEDSVTRGQVATVLWRLAGSPAASDGGVFPDVPAGQYYSQAVSWAYSIGIITGYTAGEHAGTFQPDASVSREEFAVMVYRFAAWEGVQTFGAPESAFDSCADAASVSGWSREAMVWCAAAGVITGKDVAGGPLLAPQAGATRAEAAKILVVTSRLVGGEVPYALDDADDAVEAQAIESEAEQPAEQAEEATFDDVAFEDVAATEAAARGESGQVAAEEVEVDLIEADASADDAGKAAVEAATEGEQAALDDIEFDDITEALAA